MNSYDRMVFLWRKKQYHLSTDPSLVPQDSVKWCVDTLDRKVPRWPIRTT